MTLLFVDKTKAGTSGWIFGIERDSASRCFLVDESNANLLWQTVVAVSGRVEAGRARSFRFRFRR